MRIEKKKIKPEFEPLTLTLETEEELKFFKRMIPMVVVYTLDRPEDMRYGNFLTLLQEKLYEN